MSLTQSRMVRRLVSDRVGALLAIEDMNFPRLPIQVLSYPLARQPWGSQKFERTVASREKLLAAVDEALKASTIQKALLIGWPRYRQEAKYADL